MRVDGAGQRAIEMVVVRSRRRPGGEGRCVKKKEVVTRGGARAADRRSMSGGRFVE